jgi:two-component system, LytTR family, response regulator
MPNKTIKSIIVDDEQPACELLVKYLHEYCPEISIEAVCRSANKAYVEITERKPDLIFLDIEMPRMNGFELLKKLSPVTFNVIFITAFSEYAAQAFRISAVDYLLKPIKINELIEAVGRVRSNIENNQLQNISSLLKNSDVSLPRFRKLLIPGLKGTLTINPEDVIYCEAEGYCTIFHLTKNRRITSSYNLKHFEELLPSSVFFRVHNSFMINLEHLEGYNNLGEITLSGGNKCPLGASRKKAFQKTLKKG